MTRFLLHTFPVPTRVAAMAEVCEGDGWDGVLLADSQNLVGDPYCELTLAASVTDRLELGPFVTNPVTRHPAVTASAIATVQEESGGRAVVGIGRGDSSLALIGRPRATLDQLGTYVDQLRHYLSGEPVEIEGHESRLAWVAESSQPRVPIDVVASGRRSISLAAACADRVTFALGASPDRIRWAIDTARAARSRAGLPSETLKVGACLVAAVTSDRDDDAAGMVRANVGIFARFLGQAAAAGGAPDATDLRTEEAVAAAYNQERHGLASAPQTALLDDDFVRDFAVVGSADHCVERLTQLADTGLDHIVVVGPSRDVDAREALALTRRFATEVLPGLRETKP
ncbi:MAG TPA: LLM class flavin-dependent oxidoreductase [Acidimicrobiales bacterium]|nr:LLM class flavin-dependent oxidoreductase [Acidimicrobiales bacterium]